MKYLAVLGRQPEISVAELEALFGEVKQITGKLAVFYADKKPEIDRLGGSLKLAELIDAKPLDYLRELAEGKITLGVSDFSRGASKKTATIESLKLKKILVRHGRSVRVVENKDAVISTATSLHNGLSGKNERKVELIKVNDEWYKVIGVQDIDAYTKRDQARPARDAKVGMLPPKLAQILINLCGDLPAGSRVLDPFCGTGVVLQEALLMGYQAYGTDINERMVEYTEKNLEWLVKSEKASLRTHSRPFGQAYGPQERLFQISQGDATSFQWEQPIDAVACEGYLGKPMSAVPAEIKLKTEKQECKAIMVGFLKNLASQIKSGTSVVVAMPAWLREDGSYSRLEILDEITDMGYNVYNKSREGLLYHREGQIVARDLIILRKD
ncbi:DNA adenine methylase [Candidatus Saccharibacteria bacterium]|nr:DNA adenine methylase [Candidatus Saccharibacteria bacterium]